MYYKFFRFGPFGGHERPFKKLEAVFENFFYYMYSVGYQKM